MQRIFIFFMCVVFSNTLQSQTNLTPKEIIQKAEAKSKGVTSAQSIMKISTIRPKWTREMTLKSWSKGDDFSLMLIQTPQKDKGITFLKRQKEVWNWVPSIERVVKLPPSMMSQSWMGTDLTNDDLVKESSTVKDYNHKLLEDKMIDGHLCYQIELTPKEDAAVIWDKIIAFVDKKNFVQRRAEMYDEDGELVNVMRNYNVQTVDGRELATTMEFIPMDKEGHKTVIEILSIEFDKPISDGIFTIQNMKKAK